MSKKDKQDPEDLRPDPDTTPDVGAPEPTGLPSDELEAKLRATMTSLGKAMDESTAGLCAADTLRINIGALTYMLGTVYVAALSTGLIEWNPQSFMELVEQKLTMAIDLTARLANKEVGNA